MEGSRNKLIELVKLFWWNYNLCFRPEVIILECAAWNTKIKWKKMFDGQIVFKIACW